jgi:LmbE family N-acetylglucosaminyl deacetylase
MIRFLRPLLAFLLLHSSLFISVAQAQAPKTYTSSEILLGLKKLKVLGSVLYIAAHPDDENTRLLAYLANERLLETGYLSCTRGDGGQNLIGPELREQLGVIRTQELLAARRIDGARQFFTRANDFGFSKTPEETFTIWDKEQVLADMVWVIRQRRPDVLITRFPPDGRAGHGHHTASAMLAIEAFSAAGDAKRFPEQLQYVQPWSPRRLLWNTGSFFVKPGDDLSKFLKVDAGGYNPLLGQSYGEIAARSRSQHRSQGFGSAATRGEALEYFTPLRAGDVAPKELFEGVDMSWNRVPGGAAVGKMIDEVIQKYDPSKPEASVAGLLHLRGKIVKDWDSRATGAAMESQFWRVEKGAEIDELIKACLGISFDVVANQSMLTAGEAVELDIKVVNRSAIPIELSAIHSMELVEDSSMVAAGTNPGAKHISSLKSLAEALRYNIPFTKVVKLHIAKSDPISQAYWLRDKGSIGMYKVPEVITPAIRPPQHMGKDGTITRNDVLGKPENPPAANLVFLVKVAGNLLIYQVPVQYKHTDPTLGELYQPLVVVPPVIVNMPAGRAYVFADQQPKTIPVTLRAGRAGVAGTLALQAPQGWEISPATAAFSLKNKDEEQTLNFSIKPGAGAAAGRAELRATATVDGQAYTRGIQQIVYPHIPTQTLFPEAVAPLVKLDLKRRGQNLAYLMGAGDEVPEALRQVGYNVTLLDPNTDLTLDRLRRFDAVVLGIRAYNTVDKLKTQQAELLKYIEQGGNVIVQYVVTRGTVMPEIGPYPMKLSNDRVTVEDAQVTFLKPTHPLLTTPNKISAEDFQGWVQEQGLYYPSSWDPKYQPVISSHDPGEPAKESAILVADYGKGHYIYTGLSLFRELPAGVPGAFRLLTNMISYGKEPAQ